MGTAQAERTFHKHLPVLVQRKKFFGKTSPHRAYIQDINIHGGRLFTREPLKQNCHICITFRDPDSDTDRVLYAKVTRHPVLARVAPWRVVEDIALPIRQIARVRRRAAAVSAA